MTYLTESRDALATALEAAIYADAEWVDPHERVMLPRMVADALIASGAVIAASTLADDEALISDLDSRSGWGCGTRDALEVLAAALTERSQR